MATGPFAVAHCSYFSRFHFVNLCTCPKFPNVNNNMQRAYRIKTAESLNKNLWRIVPCCSRVGGTFPGSGSEQTTTVGLSLRATASDFNELKRQCSWSLSLSRGRDGILMSTCRDKQDRDTSQRLQQCFY